MCPKYLCENFIKRSERHNHNTRDSHLNFVVPKVKGQGINTFHFSSIKAWNSLPSNIKSINSYHSFKKEVKSHLALKSRLREGGDSIHWWVCSLFSFIFLFHFPVFMVRLIFFVRTPMELSSFGLFGLSLVLSMCLVFIVFIVIYNCIFIVWWCYIMYLMCNMYCDW